MKKFIQEFKEFALRGNVMDLAVGMIIGAAFSDIVTALVDNFINPILYFVTGAESYDTQQILGFCSNFVGAVINFVIMAFILFCLVRAINKMMTVGKHEEPAAPTTKTCPFCKSEIAIEASRCPHCTSEQPVE